MPPVGLLAAATVAATLLGISAVLPLARESPSWRSYDPVSLVKDTLELLHADASVPASMEAMRRAVIDAHGSRPWAIIAQYWPHLNDRADACGELSFRPANSGVYRASCP